MPDPYQEIIRHMSAARREAIEVTQSYLLEDCSPGTKLACEYAIRSGYEDFESFDPRHQDCWGEFEDWAKEFAADRADEEADRILDEAEILPDGRLRLWRAMTVPTDWIEEGIHKAPIGKCWAWDPAFAIPHQGEGWHDPDRMLVKIRATVDVAGIDWVETLALNAAGEFTVGDEKEIRLHEEALVEVETIEWAPFGESYKDGDPVHFEPGELYPAGKACAPALSC